jgi:hypothetical protein
MTVVNRTYLTSDIKYPLFAIAFATALTLYLHPDMAGADVTRYLYWTHTLFFDRDLLLINEFEEFGERLLITPTGYAVEFHNVGTAIFWLPFYAAAYFLDVIVRPDDSVRTGFEPIYILLINFSTWLYAGLTVLGLYHLACRFSRPHAAFWAIVFVSLGTSFFYYTVFLPASSHVISAFLATTFLRLWLTARRQPRWPLWLAMGVIGGLLLLVANYNLPYLILPLLSSGSDIYRHGLNHRHSRLAGVYLLSAFLMFTPQLFIWWLLFGSPLVTPYRVQLAWLQPQLILTWFSAWHGLFVFAPIVYLTIPGAYYLFKRDKTLAIQAIILFLFFSYIISINAAWWGGTSFGARYFISLTPIFVITVAAFLDRFQNPGAYLAAAMMALWTLLLYTQTTAGLMNLHNWYPINILALRQWEALRSWPRLIYDASLPATTSPLFTLVPGLAVVGGLIFGAGPRLIQTVQHKWHDQALYGLPALGVIVIVFIGYAGLRSQAIRNQLERNGFYQNKQQIYRSDPFDMIKNYHKLASFYQEQAQPQKAVAAIQTAMQNWPDQTRKIVILSSTSERPEGHLPHLAWHPFDINFGNVVRLIGYTLQKEGAAGYGENISPAAPVQQLNVGLYWERLSAEVDEVHYTFSLSEYRHNREIARHRIEEGLLSPGIAGVYPLDEIPTGMFFKDSFVIPYRPDDQFGKIELVLDQASLHPTMPAGTAPARITIGFVELSATELMLPLNYNFDNKMALTGYWTGLDHPAQTLSLALRWQGITPPDRDYKLFTHLVDSKNEIVTQRDVEPLSGLRPTTTWQPKEEIIDLYDIPLPEHDNLDTLSIVLGFYFFETGERLFLVNSNDGSGSTKQNFVRLKIE